MCSTSQVKKRGGNGEGGTDGGGGARGAGLVSDELIWSDWVGDIVI